MKRSSMSRLELPGEDGERLALVYTNRGDPYREGIRVELYDGEFYGMGDLHVGVDLFGDEPIQLRDKLLELYPLDDYPVKRR